MRSHDAQTLAKAAIADHEVRSRKRVVIPAAVGIAVVLIVILRVLLRAAT
jgi:hypothetical protein